MKINDVRLIPLTDREINVIIDHMRKFIPIKEDEEVVVAIVEKLRKSLES